MHTSTAPVAAIVRSEDQLSNLDLFLQRADALRSIAVEKTPPPPPPKMAPICLSSTLQFRAVEPLSTLRDMEPVSGRGDLKRILMAQDPHCTGCREPLTHGGKDANCNLAADHLFCNWCINMVRQKRRPRQLEIIATMKRLLAERDEREAKIKAETRPALLIVPNCAKISATNMDLIHRKPR